MILSFQRVLSLLNQIKVFLALIIGSVFRVSFDLSQGVMCDSAVISSLNIKGKFNVNLISVLLKTRCVFFFFFFFFLIRLIMIPVQTFTSFHICKYLWFYRIIVRKVMHFIII